jgi:hypothetical protein
MVPWSLFGCLPLSSFGATPAKSMLQYLKTTGTGLTDAGTGVV